MKRSVCAAVWSAVVVLCAAPWVQAEFPLSTVFSYQGLLKENNAPANGCFEFRCTLYDAPTGGNVLRTWTSPQVWVQGGLFTLHVDFGQSAFSGYQRWVEVEVRPCGGGPWTTMEPRHEVAAVPQVHYAVTADDVGGFHANSTPDQHTLLPLDEFAKYPISALYTGPGSGLDADSLDGAQGVFYQNATNLIFGTLPDPRLAGAYSSPLTFANAGNSFTGNGGGLTSLNASNIASGTLPDGRLSANVALLGGVQTFTGVKTFSAAPSFTAAGAPFSVTSNTVVPNLNADMLDAQGGAFYQNAGNLNAGTLPSGRLSGTYSNALAFSNAANSFAGNGANLTSLNAANLASGTLPSGRLAGTYSSTVNFANDMNSFLGNDATFGELAANEIQAGLVDLLWGLQIRDAGSLLLLDTVNDFGWSLATADNGTRLLFRTGASSQQGAVAGFGVGGYFGILNGVNPAAPLHVETGFNAGTSVGVVHAVNTTTSANDTPAVYGQHSATDFFGIGVKGVGGYRGVEGRVSPTGSGAYTGVYGYISTSSGTGTNRGVYGYAYGGSSNYGVYGVASGGATNYAGYFSGNAHVTGTLSKGGGAFKIDHPLDPENKYLLHSFVESPDMMNIYNGNVVTDGRGYATVSLPEWFEALNRDFRYQLTVVDDGDSADFVQAKVVSKVQGNQFTLRTSRPRVEVSWQVTGIRRDPFANANRIPVEVDKRPDERGLYLHPEAWGQAEERGVDHKHLAAEREP